MDSAVKMLTTHDTSSAGFTISDFSTFLSHLTDAVSAAWPDRVAARYRRVKALLMSWDRDDLDVESEIRHLESVFKGLYHYDTECWKIPSRRTAVELSRKVADLVDSFGREGNLLILYYGGHARPSEQAGGSPVWVANRSRDSATVHSSILHSLLGEVDCDALLLHDCCHAIQTGEAFTGNGLVETLAAGGFEPTSAEGDNRLFTASLVQELAHAAHTTDWLSVVELHRRLINRLQTWTPGVSFADDVYSLVQVDRRTGQPMLERPRRRTPIHSFLANKPRTIVLTPLPLPAQKQGTESFMFLNPPTVQHEVVPDGPGILVTCRLRNQHVDVEKWRQWLLGAPDRAKSIQISALYPSLSTVLILELPLVVWDLLPASPAISFIAYTAGKNHISEFRRALLGFDLDEASDTTDDESYEEHETRAVKRGSNSNRRGRKASKPSGEDRGRATLWPKKFESDRSTHYAVEDIPYCLNVAEMQGHDNTSKAERIISAFVQDSEGPATRYLCDEIQAFCGSASFEALSSGQEVAPDTIVILDERSPPGSLHPWINGMQFLSPSQLYEALSPKSMPRLIETELKADHFSPRRRLIYVTNLNPTSLLAMISTASQTQVLSLREFVYKHLTFQPGMDVKLHGCGSLGFQLSFHLPFFAWRQGSKTALDTRLGEDKRPLRNSREVKFLNNPRGQSQTYIHEAQISCMVAGVDNRHWTAYGFFDTFHDGGESKHNVRFYQSVAGETALDPLTGGRHASDNPVWDAREYFLRVMESCVGEATEEWQNVGRQMLKALKPYVSTRDDNWRQTQAVSQQTMQILEHLVQGLSGTISAWERFRESDLAYFDVVEDAPTSQTNTMMRNVEDDMRALRVLEESLRRQLETFSSLTSRLLVRSTTQNTARTNVLLTTSLSFLPFSLAALVANAPASISVIRLTSPTRYILASATLAGLATVLFLVLTHWPPTAAAAATEKIVQDLLNRVREIGLSSYRGGTKRRNTNSWQRPAWWGESGGHGKGYTGLSGRSGEEGRESEDDEGGDRGRGLPF
ncbi:hypothetical protein C8A03DRAFT_16533 [Achaetomium macrosporum]|uniref:Uncharacterized protein n=1 Tax=Achaetomium macrosporum TaxID=79813 RepID=A0AAN7H659_9PEZI|nr:hypothetical protein C8A03DRAFT_16533 [Achaetomium macrosporum]